MNNFYVFFAIGFLVAFVFNHFIDAPIWVELTVLGVAIVALKLIFDNKKNDE